MLLYRTPVINAITEIVEPALKECVEKALTTHLGSDWYETHGRKIMRTYSFVNDLETAINAGVPAIEAMDLPAIIYLLSPAKNTESDDSDEDDEVIDNNGMLLNVAAYYGWNEWQQRKILKLRVIRNLSFHNKLPRNVMPSDEYLKSGKQEKIWLEEADTALKIMFPERDLNKYKNELVKRVMENQAGTKEDHDKTSVTPGMIGYIREMESIRKEISRFGTFDFADAPLGMPLSGPAPWTSVNDDLESLHWPSMAMSNVTNGNTSHSQSRPSNHTGNTTANDVVNKGMNKLLGWLSGKK